MARSIKGEVRVDGPVLGMSSGCAVERAAGKAFVRIYGCSTQICRSPRGAVSEATATAESVVVEALRMSNSLCEAMGEPSRRAGSKKKGKWEGSKALKATN